MPEPETENDDDPHDRVQNASFSNNSFPDVTAGIPGIPMRPAALRERVP
jgi:hypothetical protein